MNPTEQPENRYEKAFIYRIHGNGKTYIRSSICQTISHRLSKHKAQYKYFKASGIGGCCTSLQCLDDPECYIELLEKYPCKDRDELRKRERFYQQLEADRVNNRIAISTPEEKEAQLKLYREANREYYRMKAREWREKNKNKDENNNISIENKKVTISF